MVKSSQIKEIVLNRAYCTQDEFESLVNRGIPVRWMNEDEGSDQDIFTLEVDE